MRPACSPRPLCRVTFETGADRRRKCRMRAPVLPVQTLPSQSVSGDVTLDVENTELCPVRRMLAAVGHEAPFEQGGEQMELLAGLSVTTKAVEHGRSHRKILKFARSAAQRPYGQVAHPDGSTHSHFVCGDGWHRHSCEYARRGRPWKQTGRQPAHTRSQAGLRIHATTLDEEAPTG